MGASFRNTMTPPPGGRFFYEADGERIEAHTWLEMEPKMLAFMQRHHISGAPVALVAEHMCPRLPNWYCTGGAAATRYVTPAAAWAASAPYFRKTLVPFDRVSERLRQCCSCPQHSRPFCLTCTGLLDRIMSAFGGRRVRVPEDTSSGVCRACNALEAVIASVDCTEGEPPDWGDKLPDTCWRNQ